MEISDFVLEQVFNRIESEDGPVWWRECAEPGEGYMIVWGTGQELHTYRYPPNFLE